MKFTKSIETSDLKLFGSLEEAQKHELTLLFPERGNDNKDGIVDYTPQEIATEILGHAEKIIDILTTTERSRPAARKINGATRKKRGGVVAAPATEGAR